MHTFIEDLEGLWKRIIITVSCDYVNKTIIEKFKTLSQTMLIDGFRCGKIPFTMLEQKYGVSIRQTAIIDLMKKNFLNIVSKHKIKAISQPKYHIIESCNDISKQFVYSVDVEVYPTIQLTGLNSIIIEKPIITIAKNDIDLIIYSEKQKYIFWERCDDKKIDIGDRITFNIFMKSNNIKINQNMCCHNIENIIMIIGQNTHNTVYNLSKNMIGRIKGDKFHIYIDFPNKHMTHITDKGIQCIVTIKTIEIAKFSKLGRSYFKAYHPLEIKENIQHNLDTIIKQYMKNQVINSILLANNFDIPITLVQNELNYLKNKIKKPVYYIDDRQSKCSLYSLIFKKFNLEYQAKRKVKYILLLDEIIRYTKINIDYKSVPKSIEKTLGKSDYSKKIIRSFKNNVIARNCISFVLLEELVIDFLIKQAKITEKKITLSEFMNVME